MRWLKRALPVVLAVLMAAQPGLAMAHQGIDRRTNRFRVNHELRRLPTSPVLQTLARQRVRQLYYLGFYHDFSWGSKSGCSVGWGENLAYRSPPPRYPGRYFFRAWKGSPDHRALMLGRWNAMASATWTAPNGRMYAVQLFGLGCTW